MRGASRARAKQEEQPESGRLPSDASQRVESIAKGLWRHGINRSRAACAAMAMLSLECGVPVEDDGDGRDDWCLDDHIHEEATFGRDRVLRIREVIGVYPRLKEQRRRTHLQLPIRANRDRRRHHSRLE